MQMIFLTQRLYSKESFYTYIEFFQTVNGQFYEGVHIIMITNEVYDKRTSL